MFTESVFAGSSNQIQVARIKRLIAPLPRMSGAHVQHTRKALRQMNLLLRNVVSDITGKTGMKVIRSILQGERNAKKLALTRDGSRENTEKTIQKSLRGHYQKEHLFALKQAVELYDVSTQT